MTDKPVVVHGVSGCTGRLVCEDLREHNVPFVAAIAGSVQPAMPPRENPRLSVSLDSVYASGPLGRAHCAIHGNQTLLGALRSFGLVMEPELTVRG